MKDGTTKSELKSKALKQVQLINQLGKAKKINSTKKTIINDEVFKVCDDGENNRDYYIIIYMVRLIQKKMRLIYKQRS